MKKLTIKLYPNVPFVTDHDFYTNSFHYFVERKPTPFEKLDFEAPFQKLSNGGFISYVELPCMKDNLDALEAIWDYSYKAGIGYLKSTPQLTTVWNATSMANTQPMKKATIAQTVEIQILKPVTLPAGSAVILAIQ
ncbi:anaerobic ribonucleoside-triphosphate reductase [Lactiplantibacillus plantarum]|uniref:anaerobic ribonucleoside-triphosphate reductase n=1 Tax=Lactiplantibacillus plantarum TaxID=1590 RepID=UPI002307DB31|nr:anaerobic ribonucleoside-triphosphate reductase [Lactiplantibacillus plantarum]WCE45099.1 anaerobic ribonucleoside-triphosphate reductase [Lactiplantibacillus plantarum]